MRKLLILGLAVLLAFAFTIVFARGKWHVKGTVASIDTTHMEVKTKDGRTVNVKLTEKIWYMKGDAEAKSGDVKPGMKVSVHLADDGSAGEVRMPSEAGSMKP